MKTDNITRLALQNPRRWLNHSFYNAVRIGVFIVVAVALTGCGLLPSGNQDQVQTSVAETVAAAAPTATSTTLPSPTTQPTFTTPPTQAGQVTDTLQPPAPPSLTPIPFTPVFPTLGPTSQSPTSCCNLRVRNQNNAVTLWIGTTLPYGGNYIEPLHYVEFYPGKETWMRIFWCRRIDHNSWTAEAIDDFEDHWRNDLRFYCQQRDVWVDEPMKEISVQ